MIEDPGSFSGIDNSPIPQRGPEASHQTSLAIFISDPAQVAKAPLANTSSSCAESAANLFGMRPERHLGEFSNLLTCTLSKFRMRIQAGANGGAPEC